MNNYCCNFFITDKVIFLNLSDTMEASVSFSNFTRCSVVHFKCNNLLLFVLYVHLM